MFIVKWAAKDRQGKMVRFEDHYEDGYLAWKESVKLHNLQQTGNANIFDVVLIDTDEQPDPPPDYVLPEGWSSITLMRMRERWGLGVHMFPVVMEHGIVGWVTIGALWTHYQDKQKGVQYHG